MSVQYKTNVFWDPSLVSLMLVEDTATTREAKIAGLVQSAIKITTGAPSTITTAGKFIIGATIQNPISGGIYENTGTVAAPVWTLMATGGGNFNCPVPTMVLTPQYPTNSTRPAAGGGGYDAFGTITIQNNNPLIVGSATVIFSFYSVVNNVLTSINSQTFSVPGGGGTATCTSADVVGTQPAGNYVVLISSDKACPVLFQLNYTLV